MKFKIQKSKGKMTNSRGFTMVEVLVSLGILSTALTGISYVLISNRNAARVVENNFMADTLVQEGVELVRNLRDSDWLASPSLPFGAFGSAGVVPDGDYRVQWDSTQLLASASLFLKKDGATGLFSYDPGTDTIFKRTVTLTTISSFEKSLVVDVSWNEKSGAKSVSAEDHLFDWK